MTPDAGVDWRFLAEDMLISVYVPEADQYTREDALSLAIERDGKAAEQVYLDSQLNLEGAVKVAYQ